RVRIDRLAADLAGETKPGVLQIREASDALPPERGVALILQVLREVDVLGRGAGHRRIGRERRLLVLGFGFRVAETHWRYSLCSTSAGPRITCGVVKKSPPGRFRA